MELERREEAKVFFKASIQNNRAGFGSVMREIALADLHAQLDADPENLGLLNAVASLYNIKKEYKKSIHKIHNRFLTFIHCCRGHPHC